jgi:serine/threonine protein kinase
MSKCPHCEKEHDPANHFCPITGQAIPFSDRMVGQILLAKYEIVSFLGHWFAGGTFKVRAKDGGKTDYVAKIVHPQFVRHSTELDLYASTVEKWMNVSHPNVARVLQIGRDEAGVPIIIREYLDGLHLQEVFKKPDVAYNLPESAVILEGLLQGLAVLHEAGVKSGRLTASDVFLLEGEGGETVVKVGDFGEYLLESIRGDEASENEYVKLYKAPEQVREGTTEFASDIFAAGVILYRLLTGRFPYPAGIPGKPEKVPGFEAVVEIKPDMPSAVDYNLRRAMAIFARDRFKTAALFAKTLEGFLPENPPAFEDMLKHASIPREMAIKSRAAEAPVVKRTGRPRMDTIKMDQKMSLPPLEIASATTQQFDSTVPEQIKEAIERHSSPDEPPGAVSVPYDQRPDAWKEERKLVPRSSKTPSRPPPPRPESVEEPALAPELAGPPAEVKPAVERPAPGPSLKAATTAPPRHRPAARAAAPQEESLAPIMPARHAKWFILGAVAVVVLLLAWGIKSFISPGSGGSGDENNVAADGKKDAGTAVSSGGDARSEAAAAPVVEDAVEEAAEEGPAVSLLEGLKAAADAQEEPDAPEAAVEEKPEKIEIKVSVSPAKAVVTFDGKKAKKPYRFSMDKSQEQHDLKVEMKEYEPYETTVTAEESREIDVVLVKIPPPEPEETAEETEAASKPPDTGKKKGGKKGKKGKKGTGLVEDVPF